MVNNRVVNKAPWGRSKMVPAHYQSQIAYFQGVGERVGTLSQLLFLSLKLRKSQSSIFWGGEGLTLFPTVMPSKAVLVQQYISI